MDHKKTQRIQYINNLINVFDVNKYMYKKSIKKLNEKINLIQKIY